MIDLTNVVSEFSVPNLQAFINDYVLSDLQFKRFFPSQFTPTLTFESLQGTFSAKVAADVVAMDSRAPRKGRQTPGKITGDIPKIEIARTKNESHINTYRLLQQAIRNTANVPQASAQAKQRLLDWIYEDTSFVLDGVNARIEWLAKQAASKGEYKLEVTNNEAGIVTPVSIKFGIPAGNITNSGTNWFGSVSTAKPITDIKTISTTARNLGIQLRFIIMDKETFDKIVLTDEVQKFTASFVANALNLLTVPNMGIVNQALGNDSLPQIRLWDSAVNFESKAGVRTVTSGWESGRVLLTEGPTLGSVQWTTPADALLDASVDKAAKSFNDFTLIKVWADQDPITMITKGLAYATPVLNESNRMYILKTNQ